MAGINPAMTVKRNVVRHALLRIAVQHEFYFAPSCRLLLDYPQFIATALDVGACGTKAGPAK
jgi:hypothetical protein